MPISFLDSRAILAPELLQGRKPSASVAALTQPDRSHWAWDRSLLGAWGSVTGGRTARDTSSYGNDGTFVGSSTSWKIGRDGYALSFDGTHDQVTLSDGILDGLSQFTICGWVYADVLGDEDSPFGGDLLPDSYPAIRYRTSGARWQWYAHDGSSFFVSAVVSGNNVISVGEWQHIALVYDGTTTAYLYVNSENVAAGGTVTAGGTLVSTGEHSCIGGAGNGSAGHWGGLVDDVRFYSGALSPAQIRDLYQGEHWKHVFIKGVPRYFSLGEADVGAPPTITQRSLALLGVGI